MGLLGFKNMNSHVLLKGILPKRFWFHCFARFVGFQIARFVGKNMKNTKNKFFQKKNNGKKMNNTCMPEHRLKNY